MPRLSGSSGVFAASSLVLLALLAPSPSRAKGPLLPFRPDPAVPGAPPLTGEAWSLATASASARLERIDDAARLAFIVEKTGFSIDPFAAGPDKARGFVNFRFDLENRSGGVVVFEAEGCRLVAGDHDARSPIDLPTLQSTYELFDRDMPPAFANVRKALFDGQVLLRPGEKASGLLVYQAVDPRAKVYRVEVSWSTADGSREGFEAPYRRPKK